VIIKELSFHGFRNLKDNTVTVSDGINVIYGDNAQGKTNLLECIWMFNGVRSFRGAKDSELIGFESDYACSSLHFYAEDRIQEVRINILPNKREAFLNGVKKNSPSELIGKCTSVVFSPEHMTLVKNGPSERRKFLDGALCRLKPRYAMLFSRYNKILNQRNALLKDIPRHRELLDTLDIWDEKLSVTGGMLAEERLKYTGLLKRKAYEFHRGISEEKEALVISYQSGYGALESDGIPELTEKIKKALEKSRKEDIYTGCTNYGPHRDDLDILINGMKARIYASQGQQRSAVLSLKLSEAGILKELTGEKPVILLDDVLSELDLSRQNFLLNKTAGWQVFITCCDVTAVGHLHCGRVFYIKDGAVEEMKKEEKKIG